MATSGRRSVNAQPRSGAALLRYALNGHAQQRRAGSIARPLDLADLIFENLRDQLGGRALCEAFDNQLAQRLDGHTGALCQQRCAEPGSLSIPLAKPAQHMQRIRGREARAAQQAAVLQVFHPPAQQ